MDPPKNGCAVRVDHRVAIASLVRRPLGSVGEVKRVIVSIEATRQPDAARSGYPPTKAPVGSRQRAFGERGTVAASRKPSFVRTPMRRMQAGEDRGV
jgi:hypothetical protein